MTGPAIPFLSVIIPTYNRAEMLKKCLEALAGQDYPEDRYEIIVIDDGSQQPMEPVVRPFRESMTTALIFQENQGPASARNRGARQAKGDFLLFTDDDCVPRPNWLSAMADQIISKPNTIVAGRTPSGFRDHLFPVASELIAEYFKRILASGAGPGFATTNNLAISVPDFRQLDGFNPRLRQGEDRDFCYRAKTSGYQLFYTEDAVVDHYHALTFGQFFMLHVGYGRGSCQFHRLHKNQSGQKRWLESLSFYIKLIFSPFLSDESQKLKLSLCIGLSQIAVAIGFGLQYLNLLRSRPVPRIFKVLNDGK